VLQGRHCSEAATAAACKLSRHLQLQLSRPPYSWPGHPNCLPAASVVILEGSGEKVAYLKEPWMDVSSCRWVKWTRNDGHLLPGECVPGRFPHVAVAGKKAGRVVHGRCDCAHFQSLEL
jgi:hypothetical protein